MCSGLAPARRTPHLAALPCGRGSAAPSSSSPLSPRGAASAPLHSQAHLGISHPYFFAVMLFSSLPRAQHRGGSLWQDALGHHVLQARWVFPGMWQGGPQKQPVAPRDGWVPHAAGKSGSCKACSANPLYVLLWHWIYCTFIGHLLK